MKRTREIAGGVLLPFLMCFGWLLSSCGDSTPTATSRQFGSNVRPGTPSIEAREKVKRTRKGAPGGSATQENLAAITLPTLTDESFVEVPARRDPFRSFVDVLAVKKLQEGAQNQRNVILAEYEINSLRPVAIVTGVGNPRGMLMDPKGQGHIIRRGDYIGRGEIIKRPEAEGGDIQINWRVQKIQGEGKEAERGIYLIREDPTTPTPGQVVKFLPLYPLEK